MQQLKLKLLELGKTKTNNASPHMFNFYVVLPGCDTAGLPRAGANSKPHHYKQNVQKMEGLPKKTFTEKPFDHIRQNKIFAGQKHISCTHRATYEQVR